MRCIDADKAEKDFEETFCKHCNSYDGAKCRACDMKDGADIFNNAPTEDVQPVKHGKWIKNDIPNSELSKCTNCGYDLGAWSFKYCPNCGAKMDKKEERYVRDIFMTR